MRILLVVWILGSFCGRGEAAAAASQGGAGSACQGVAWQDGRFDRWAWLYLEMERQADEAAWKGVACPEQQKAAADAAAKAPPWRKQAEERIERLLAAKDVELMLEIEARDIRIAKIAMGPEKAAMLQEKREGAARYLAEINRGEISPQTMQWAQKHREKKDYQFLAQAQDWQKHPEKMQELKHRAQEVGRQNQERIGRLKDARAAARAFDASGTYRDGRQSGRSGRLGALEGDSSGGVRLRPQRKGPMADGGTADMRRQLARLPGEVSRLPGGGGDKSAASRSSQEGLWSKHKRVQGEKIGASLDRGSNFLMQAEEAAERGQYLKAAKLKAKALWEAEKSGLRDLSRADKRTMKYAAGGAVVGAAVGAGIGVAAGVEGSAALVAGVKGAATTVFRGGMQMARGFMRSSTARQTAQLKNVVERSGQASSLKDLAQKRDLASAGSLGLSLMKPSTRLIPAWIKKPLLGYAAKIPDLKEAAGAMTQAAGALARKSKQNGLAGRMLWKVGINQAAAGTAGALVSASESE
ncbi:MAG: hypothetical protein HY611_02020 [Elusimicrobia bacterium]|nr:hypothetical protein [Elusimicrobiota bacterium]